MDKLEKLTKVIKFSEEIVMKDDFLKAFKFIIDFTATLKKANTETIKRLEDIFNDYKSRMKTECQGDTDKAKELMMDYCRQELRTLMETHRTKITEIDNKIARVEAIKPPDEALIAKQASDLAIEAIKPTIPVIDDLLKELPKAGDLIASALELLAEEDKLKIEAIKGLRVELDELRKLKGSRTLGGGGFSVGAFLQHVIPWTETSVAPNDVLTDFVIAYTPSPTNSLEVMVDNSPLFETSDWTYTAATKTITFLIAPPNGSTIRYKCLV